MTVYVVNRNYGRFLRQAIDSVLRQDYPALEILVVDDASTDESVDVLAEYEHDSRVRIIRQSVNRGLTLCCNAAIAAAQGEFVMRLDADDYLHESAVTSMVCVLADGPDAVLVFPDYVEVDARGAVIRRVQRHDFSVLDAMSDLPAHGACTMVRRSFLNDIGGYDQTIHCQDGLDLWLSVGDGQRVLHLAEPLFFYRQHGNNLTRNERPLLRARARLIAKHVARRGLARPRVLALVPVRGRVVDPGSLALQMLGDRPLIEWTVDEALSCAGIDRVLVSSPDGDVLDHVTDQYGSRVGIHRRGLALAGLNISLHDTVTSVLAAESAQGREYDALLTLTVESPFRSSMFMQQSIDVAQLFDATSAVGVRHEDDVFYRHDGLGLRPVRSDDHLRRERDDLFRSRGGLRLVKLPFADSATGAGRSATRMGHVLLDQLAAFTVQTSLDWQLAQHLVDPAKREISLDR